MFSPNLSSTTSATVDALPYTSPSIVTILVLASYLLFLSIFYHAFQRLFSAGILGPLVLGAIYARPLANILPQDVQSAILAFGYLGLILLIVQGGLESRMDILSSPKNLAMAMLVGATGIILPIGISMALLPLAFGYGYLESFAVGAALASTSLGTTFAILSSFNGSSGTIATKGNHNGEKSEQNGIVNTRIGTILVGAALLDDIVGLVITSVISTLGSSTGSQDAGVSAIKLWIIARPIVSSFLLLLVSWLLSQFALAPLARRAIVPCIARYAYATEFSSCADGTTMPPRAKRATKLFTAVFSDERLQQLVAMSLLISTVLAYSVISEEIGSSLLIGAFCSGAMMKYLYTFWSDWSSALRVESSRQSSNSWSPDYLLSPSTALGVVQDTILMPFFSSIGSAIPVKSMFQGTTVWRGIIFAGLMAFAKVCAGGWVFLADLVEQKWADRTSQKHAQKQKQLEHTQQQGGSPAGTMLELQPERAIPSVVACPSNDGFASQASEAIATTLPDHSASTLSTRPPVWPASLFLGTALMSRGEIGFLVMNIANQGGLLGQQAFNVGIWAIVLNTLAGPISIGILMRTRHEQSILNRGTNSHLGRWT